MHCQKKSISDEILKTGTIPMAAKYYLSGLRTENKLRANTGLFGSEMEYRFL